MHFKGGSSEDSSFNCKEERIFFCKRMKSIRDGDIAALQVHDWQLYRGDKSNMPTSLATSPRSAFVTYDTTAFRTACDFVEEGRDVVIEIGCSYGKATKLLSANAGASSVLGVDTSKEALEAAKVRNPDVEFLHCDVLATPNTLTNKLVELLAKKAELDIPCELVVYVDIGGNRELEALAALLPWVASLRKQPRLIVVKSQSLYNNVIELASNSNKLAATSPALAVAVADADDADDASEAAHEFDWGRILALADAAKEARRAKGRSQRGPKRKLAESEETNPVKKAELERPKYPHPLKAPLKHAPDGIPICRFHNYVESGCFRHLDPKKLGTTCPLDHDHCHYCGSEGHVAMTCEDYAPLI